MNLVSREKSSHWYYTDGRPCYSIPCKNGNGDRAVRVTDAIKLELYPSITTITGLLANPSLEAWKQEQCIMSALTLPKIDGETLEERAHRIVEDAQREGSAAASLGSDIHKYIENYINKEEQDMYLLEAIPEIKKGIDEWLAKQTFEGTCEKVVTNREYRTAGKIDYIGLFNGKKVILDFKTQKTKEDTKSSPYKIWLYQLAGYLITLNAKEEYRLVNVILSTTEPGRIEIHQWDDEDTVLGMNVFETLRKLFRLTRGA